MSVHHWVWSWSCRVYSQLCKFCCHVSLFNFLIKVYLLYFNFYDLASESCLHHWVQSFPALPENPDTSLISGLPGHCKCTVFCLVLIVLRADLIRCGHLVVKFFVSVILQQSKLSSIVLLLNDVASQNGCYSTRQASRREGGMFVISACQAHPDFCYLLHEGQIVNRQSSSTESVNRFVAKGVQTTE